MLNDFLALSFAMMSFGACMECVVYLIGHVVRAVFAMMKGGEKE